MKMKSLLLAAAAFVALGASAQATLTSPDIEVNSEDQIGQLIQVPVTLDLGSDATWKNCQFEITFPKGFYPIKDEYDYVDDAGADVAGDRTGKFVTFSGNQATYNQETGEFESYNEQNWPDYTVVGANMKARPNPSGEVYIFYVAPREGEVENGDYEFTIYGKFILSDDSEVLIGTPEEHVKLCNVKVALPEDPSTAVSDVNAAKTVASVKYMNAAGMVSDTAFQGVNIVVTKYADGTQSTAKVVK